MDEIDRFFDHKSCDFGITIIFFFDVSYAKCISYRWSYLQLFVAR